MGLHGQPHRVICNAQVPYTPGLIVAHVIIGSLHEFMSL